MTVPEILRKAAARIRLGWCQENYEIAGGVCVFGALAEVTSRRPCVLHEDELSEPMCVAIHRMLGNAPYPSREFIPIVTWNDALGQTAENVAAGLEYAALLYEQEHAQPALAESQATGVLA